MMYIYFIINNQKTMAKKITISSTVHEFAETQAKNLNLGSYEEDFKLFEKLNPTLEVRFDTFKYYMREKTDPTFSRYKGGKSGEEIVTAASSKKQEEIKLFSMRGYNPDKKLFVPMKTGKGIDSLISKTGGFMPGTTIMFSGGPGTGKTTNGTDCLVNIKRKNPKKKCLYLNSEMKQLDLAAERLERDILNEMTDILLLAEYTNPKKAIENVLAMGWDFVLVDSFDHIIRRLKSMGVKNPDSYLLDLMSRHNDDAFKTGHYTTFLVIQQVTKGGTFKGSNDQIHDTTTYIHAEYDEEGKRFISAHKNRRNGGDVHRRMYYTLVDGEVQYDKERWDRDQLLDIRAAEEKSKIDEEGTAFSNIFRDDNMMRAS